MTSAIQSDAHAWHFFQEFGEKNYDAAFKQVEAFLLQDQHDSKELKSTCGAIGDFLPHLSTEKAEDSTEKAEDSTEKAEDSTEKAEDLLELLLTVLVKYPLLKRERAAILTHWGDLFAEREALYPNLSQMMRGYAAAYFLEPTDELSQKLLTPFLPYVYEGFRAWIEKAAREGDPERFGSLLGTYQQKFGCNLSIQRKLYEIADEIYEQLPRGNKAKFTRFVTEIQKGKQGKLPVQEGMHLIFHFQNKLKEIREGFNQKVETRPFQHARTEAFLELFHAMLEDAILMLGIPPCKYDVRAVGSLAREEVCPYSDLEYLILIEEKKHRPFFRKLAQIFSLQILSFGETEHSVDLFDCGRYGLQIDKQSNPADDESLIVLYDKFFTPPRELDPNASSDGIEQYYQMLKAKKSRFHSVSLHHNHLFPLSFPDLQKTASLFLEMRRKEFGKKAILQGHVCHIKYDLMEPLFHFLGDLGLFFGLEESNTLDLIDKLPLFTETSKRLLKTAVSDLYRLRVRLHLAHGGIQEEVSLIPSLELTTLTEQEKESLRQVYELVLIPLYQIDLDAREVDFVAMALQQPNETNVALAAQFVEEDHPRYYTMLSSPDHVALQRVYLNQVPDHREALAQIPNRAGYRLSRELEEAELQQSLQNITTDDPASGVKINSPLIGERYLKVKAAEALLDSTGHIKRTYADALHRVSFFRDLHFKEMPYQPLMEYAVHSLTHRIMGKVSPATTLAKLELSEDLNYPILISQTIEGEKLGLKTELDQEHLTWLRLCEMLTKPGDGRLSNYVVREGKVFCVDNDLSFMPVVQKQRFFKDKVSFCSMLFMLNLPLYPDVLQQFCALEPDLILPDWLEEMQRQEMLYLNLFPNLTERKRWYESKIESFTPTLPFTEGTIVTLSTQFHLLQSALKEKTYEHPLELLQKLIHFQRSGSSPEDPLVEKQYKKALQLPFNRRLSGATGRPDQSLTSAQAMELQFSERPTFEQIQPGGKYSLKQAYAELCLLEAHKLWARHIEGDSISVDFSTIEDSEREKLMLKSLAFLLESKTQKPTSISLRHTQTLTPDMLKPLLHPGLLSLDLSYGALVSEGGLFTASTLSQVETLSPNLEELYLEGCPSLVQPTITLPQLRRLNISRCPNLKSLNLKKAQLQELKINHSPRLETVQVSLTSESEVDWKETPEPAISHIAEQWYQLGKRYAEGDRVPRDPEKALSLWEKAAAGKKQSNNEAIHEAQYQLGKKYAEGDGVLKDPEKTLTLWEKAAAGKNQNAIEALPEVQYQAGKKYAEGYGVPRDPEKALALWEKAAAGGHKHAQEILKWNERFNGNPTSLNLKGYWCGEQGAATLADALKVNQTLSSLDLIDNQIGDQGAGALADALKVNQTLSSLNLRNNQIGEQGAAALADALKVNQTLSSLNLGDNQIGEQGAAAFADALKVNQTLSSLNLRVNQIREKGAAALADALKVNQTLSSLNLSLNQIREKGAAALAEALKVNQTLSSLDLWNNQIGKEGAIAIAEALKVNHTLASLHLGNNNIGAQGASAIAEALKVNQTLSSLNLAGRQIGEQGAAVLADALKVNQTLSSLNLGHNWIREQGAAALADALKVNQTLSSLDLSESEIRNQGAAALADALKVNQTLSSLDLSNSEIREKGAAALADALKVNQTLSSLNLGGNWIREQGGAALADALKVNQTLSSVNLGDNWIREQGAGTCEKSVYRNKSLKDSAFKAAQEGDTQLFHFLDQGVSIYSQDKEENTFLHLAAAHGHTHLIQPLLESAQNPTFPIWKNKEGKTALDLAREKGHAAIVELLSSQE